MKKKLFEVYNNPMTAGIFSKLQTMSVPWQALDIDGSLDAIYFGNHSGEKPIAPLVYKYLDNDGEKLTSSGESALAIHAYVLFNTKWTKLYSAITAQYNPLENYNMTESEIINKDVDNEQTHSGSDTNTKSGSESVAHSGTDTSETSGSDTDAHTGTITDVRDLSSSTTATTTGTRDVYGYNSETAVHDDASTTESEGEETTDDTNTRTFADTQTLTHGKTDERTLDLTDTTTYNNRVDTLAHGHVITDDNTENIERELTRSGNIGVTTSQQMLESEISIRQWNFFEAVFSDLDKILTLKVY